MLTGLARGKLSPILRGWVDWLERNHSFPRYTELMFSVRKLRVLVGYLATWLLGYLAYSGLCPAQGTQEGGAVVAEVLCSPFPIYFRQTTYGVSGVNIVLILQFAMPDITQRRGKKVGSIRSSS
jgi:hypothetical protein